MKKRFRVIWVSLIIVILVGVGMTCIAISSEKKRINEHIILGDKYLQNLEYDQALAEYQTVLSIDPGNESAKKGIENACLSYADDFLMNEEDLAIEQYEGLVNILEENFHLTQLKAIQKKEVEVKSLIDDKKKEYEEIQRQNEEAKRKEEELKKKKQEEMQERKEEGEKVLDRKSVV